MPKVKVKFIESLEAYISLIERLRANRGGDLWYRGCGKVTHTLKSSLYRHKQSKTIEDLMLLEKNLIARFQQRSIPFHSRALTDPWEWLFLMQHYGVPTRLLDWSESPLMALFFAVTLAHHKLDSRGQPVFNGDAAIWLLDPGQWNKRAVDLLSFTGSILTTDDPNANAYKPVVDINTMKQFPIALYGAHNSQRIVAQRGVFVCFGKDTRPMEVSYEREHFPAECLMKVVIRKDRLPHMYEALRRHGITDSVVFPDLEAGPRDQTRVFVRGVTMFTVAKLEPKPLRWWMSQRAKIDMNPPYQRHGRLWSKTDKAFLIDSILNNYDIPKIYIADFTFGNVRLNKKGLPYAIIDGKQRLEAMFDFYNGSLILDDEFVFQQNPTLKLGGLGYTDLTKNYPEIADIFNIYPLSVVHIITDEEGKINELFYC